MLNFAVSVYEIEIINVIVRGIVVYARLSDWIRYIGKFMQSSSTIPLSEFRV